MCVSELEVNAMMEPIYTMYATEGSNWRECFCWSYEDLIDNLLYALEHNWVVVMVAKDNREDTRK